MAPKLLFMFHTPSHTALNYNRGQDMSCYMVSKKMGTQIFDEQPEPDTWKVSYAVGEGEAKAGGKEK